MLLYKWILTFWVWRSIPKYFAIKLWNNTFTWYGIINFFQNDFFSVFILERVKDNLCLSGEMLKLYLKQASLKGYYKMSLVNSFIKNTRLKQFYICKMKATRLDFLDIIFNKIFYKNFNASVVITLNGMKDIFQL